MKSVVYYLLFCIFLLSCTQTKDKKTVLPEGEINFTSIEKFIRKSSLVKPVLQKHGYLNELMYFYASNFKMVPPRGNVKYFAEILYSQAKNDSGQEVAIAKPYQFWYNRKHQLIKMGHESGTYEEFTYSGDKLLKITGTLNSYRDSVLFRYDENGLLIIKEVYFHDRHREKYIYNYDSLGRNTEQYDLTDLTTQRHDSANIVKKKLFYFSKNNQQPDSVITLGIQYHSDYRDKFTYRYNNLGLKEEEVYYSSSGTKKTSFVYNRNGDLVSETYNELSEDFDYEYDEKDNWTKRTEKGNNSYYTRRILKYY
jgi:hypothetical protein